LNAGRRTRSRREGRTGRWSVATATFERPRPDRAAAAMRRCMIKALDATPELLAEDGGEG
jgi:hypothetical protein